MHSKKISQISVKNYQLQKLSTSKQINSPNLAKKTRHKKEICLRSCVGCRQVFKKDQLLRLAYLKKGSFSFSRGGRGAYLCFSKSCFDQAMKRKKDGFSFSLKKKVPPKVIDQIILSIEKCA